MDGMEGTWITFKVRGGGGGVKELVMQTCSMDDRAV